MDRSPVTTAPGGQRAWVGLPPGRVRVTDSVSSVLGWSRLSAISLTKLHSPIASSMEAPAAKFQVGSFLSVELPPCDAVTSIGECVNYAFDRRSGKEGLAEFFHRVHGALRPGGVFVFDIVEPGVVAEGTKQRRFLEGPDWAILLEVREDRRRKTLTRQIASFRRMGKLYRRSEEIHRLHLYSGSELLAELSRAGFEARLLGGYGRFRFPPAHVGFLARKPAAERTH